MAIAQRQSLFESSDSSSSIGEMVSWMNGTLLGELAVIVSVIAVALIGFALLTGRFDVRGSGRTVLGIFILLGAPVIAAAFVLPVAITPSVGPRIVFETESPELKVRPDLPPATYDPYAGASLRRD